MTFGGEEYLITNLIDLLVHSGFGRGRGYSNEVKEKWRLYHEGWGALRASRGSKDTLIPQTIGK